MIAKARLLMRSASYGELAGFAVISVAAVALLGSSGAVMVTAVPELAEAKPGLTGAYLVEVFGVLWPVLYALIGAFVAFKNYQTFQDIIARCELAEDELAWVKDHPEYERMIEDRELMRLTANMSRLSRTYQSQNLLLERFLGEYRTLLENYGSGMEKTRQARIQHMNEAADEGLERNARRVQREQMKRNREKS